MHIFNRFKRITILFGVIVSLIGSIPAQAQTAEDRLVTMIELLIALDRTDDSDIRLAILLRLNSELNAISVDPSATDTFLQLIQQDSEALPVYQAIQNLIISARTAETPPPAPAICTSRDTILRLSDLILAERHSLGRFQVRGYGATAAYMKIHYGDMSPIEITTFLGDLVSQKVRHVDELESSYNISVLGNYSFGPAYELSDLTDRFFNLSALRALALVDDGKTLFELVNQIQSSGADQSQFTPYYFYGIRLPIALSDQSDDVHERVAQNALNAGEIVAALALMADMRDTQPYLDLLATLDTESLEYELARSVSLETNGVTLRWNTGPLNSDGKTDPAYLQSYSDIYDILRSGYMSSHLDFLSIFMNQTGTKAESAIAAREFTAEVDAGRIDPLRNPERGWIQQYTTLVFELGQDTVDVNLASFDMSPRFMRHYSRNGRALATIHWAVAIDALRPFMTGETDTLPAALPLLASSAHIDWPVWLGIATDIKIGDEASLTSSLAVNSDSSVRAQIAIEMALLAGQSDRAIAIAGERLSPQAEISFYLDYLKRLDRSCGAHTAHPGQGIFLGGMYLFKF